MGTIRTSLSAFSASTTIEAIDKGDDGLTTTALALSTTLSSSFPDVNIVINTANSYIDSLSDEELAKFDQQLELKELEFMDSAEVTTGNNTKVINTIHNNSQAKVYKKV
ncbi:MAG: hypothetical protein HFE81_04395 [Bacilli bacterium]|nr:hypothetical protein [Bacilli bacterium]